MASIRWFSTVALLQACAITPHLNSRAVSGEHVVIVGEDIVVSGRWYRTCSDRTGWSDGEAQEIECETRPSRLEVRVQGACVRGPGTDEEIITVVPTSAGTCRIDATTTRLDNGKTRHASYEYRIVDVEPELYCFGEQRTGHACAGHTVSAGDPRIHVQARIDEAWHMRGDTTVNGMHVGVQQVSLVDLFPDAKQGQGVQPGPYEVEVAYGGRTRQYQLDVR